MIVEEFTDRLGRKRTRTMLVCEHCGATKQAGRKSNRYCSYACMGAARTARTADSFWSLVDKTGDCWTWLGAKTDRGYGVIAVGRKQHRAHRLAWELTNGAIPDGMFVCHHCDNPSCVRPDHLFIGAPLDNTLDMVAKGRHAHGDRHWTRINPTKARDVVMRNARRK